MFENVKGLWSTKNTKKNTKNQEIVIQKGYVFVDKLVNSLEYGVPQERERVILFGIKYLLLDPDKKTARNILKNKFDWGSNKNTN